MHRFHCLLGFLAIAVTASTARSQTPGALPPIVQQRIDGETFLVARIDLSDPGLATIGRFLRGLPDPTASFGTRLANFDEALKALAALNVKEIFAIVSTSGLPTKGVTFVIPGGNDKAKQTAIADALKPIWPDEVTVASDGVIVEQSASRQATRDLRPAVRPEFAAAFAAMKESKVQIAIGLGADTRRALRELLPVIPRELGGGSIAPVADGWQWIALGLTPSPKLDVQLVVQAIDAASADALARIITTGLKSAAEIDSVKAVLPNPLGMVALLTPSKKADRLIVSLNETNGGAARFMDQVASPVLSQMEKDARRMKSINNLKQIVLAMHIYHDKHGTFPPQALRSKNGDKLLSWRVLLLPFLGQESLYKEFRLDEPWDSEHNLKLVTQMPDLYASSNINREQRTKGMTTYLGVVAEKTLFASSEGIPIRKIIDGTSNTIAVVAANADRAVPWTKPDDLEVDLKHPLNGLMGQPGGVFRAGLCDGSVRMIKDSIAPETLRRLFQIDDGEKIGDF